MKKLIIALMILALALPAAALADTLADVQDYIYRTAPVRVGNQVYTLSGEVMEIRHLKNYHWEMVVKVDEEKAFTAFGSEYPYFIAEFSVYEDMPFSVGDIVTVCGPVNPMYSSFAVPNINSNTINGIEVR